MTKEELGELYPVAIKPFDVRWGDYYAEELTYLRNFFSEEIAAEHIGSTAVRGLAAKATIDIAMDRPVGLLEEEIIARLTPLGYIHMPDVKGYPMFVKGYTPTGLEEISYHIHMAGVDSLWSRDRIAFRDYLNSHENYRREYKELKEKLAVTYRNDRDAYTAAKADFVIRVTEEAKK